MLIDRNAGLVEPEVIGIGTTSYCEQEMGPANLGAAVCAIERHYQFVALFPYGRALCIKAQVDAFALQYLAHRGGDIFVFAINQRDFISTIVTSLPKRRYIWPNSRPT